MKDKLKEIIKKFLDAGIQGNLPMLPFRDKDGKRLSEEKQAEILEKVYKSYMKARAITDKKKEDE
jgi:hypothetical protein